MYYELEHQGTQLGTGQFACVPRGNLDFEDALEYLQSHPNDDFMHKHLLHLAGKFGPNLTRQLIQRGREENPHLTALLYEACILNERLQDLKSEFSGSIRGLAEYTPLIYINWSLTRNTDAKSYWLKLFSENILEHEPATPKDRLAYPIPFDRDALDAWARRVAPIAALQDQAGGESSQKQSKNRPDAAETAAWAMERLKGISLETGPETENPASLSPHGLQIQWLMQVHVSTGRNHWELMGLQTSYGKGLQPDHARASCLMEVVERVSSFASFDADSVLHYRDGHPLIRGSYEDLRKASDDVLDPNDMYLEVPYENQPLYWIGGERVGEHGTRRILVPAQLVFLFSNLDEISLTSGLPSTGLASGNTLEEARLHALLEVIERDAEKIMPYSKERCFLLESELPEVKEILKHSADAGVEVQFLDMTTELGVPCYKAFLRGPDGQILKGCAADLDGKRAAASALMELPYHTSWFRPVAAPPGLRKIKDQALPDYSSGNARWDLELLERLLVMNGYRPIYVNLTRDDLNIPVVKAIIPGLELFAEFDRFSRFSVRQFAHYLKAAG